MRGDKAFDDWPPKIGDGDLARQHRHGRRGLGGRRMMKGVQRCSHGSAGGEHGDYCWSILVQMTPLLPERGVAPLVLCQLFVGHFVVAADDADEVAI